MVLQEQGNLPCSCLPAVLNGKVISDSGSRWPSRSLCLDAMSQAQRREQASL